MKLTHQLAVLVCLMAALASCRSSDSGSGKSAVQSGFVNRARFASLSTGVGTFFNFTGSDSNGLKYKGSTQTIVIGPGPVPFNIFSTAIQKTSTLIISPKTGTSPVLSPYFYGFSAPVATYTLKFVATYYYHLDKTLYKVSYSPSGLTATPANIFSYPANLTFQNVTSGQALNYSNGNLWTSTWGVTDNGGGAEQFQITWFNNSALSEIDTYIIDSTGIILRYSGVLQNFPIPGVTTTISSY
jgi:hypothetical protein